MSELAANIVVGVAVVVSVLYSGWYLAPRRWKDVFRRALHRRFPAVYGDVMPAANRCNGCTGCGGTKR